MAAKRVAGRQLTDQNWEEEEEPEDPGVFKPASEDIIKGREIKKAKRRIAGPTEGESGSGSAFKGFSGFSGLSSSTTTKPAFGFGSTSKPPGGLTNGGSSSTTATFSFGSGSSSSKPLGVSSNPPLFGATTKQTSVFGGTPAAMDKKPLTNGTKDTASSKSAYLAHLRSLNEAVSKWIKEHVDKDPYCLLTPIFKDYEKYLGEFEKKYPDHASGSKKEGGKTSQSTESSALGGGFKLTAMTSSTTTSSTTASKSEVSTAASSTTTSSSLSSTSAPFTFGTGSTTLGSSTAASGFTFGGSASSTATSGFSFKPSSDTTSSASSGFSFATGKPASQESQGADKEEEYVPPKAESVEIKEDDAFYTKRCKLFYQKSGAWMERGVGNLYLKPCGDKTQALMRADTSLGTILLNIMLASSIPFKRQGKNNVSFICVPNPPIDPDKDEKKPCSMMIRVKTAEDADELFEKIEEHKN